MQYILTQEEYNSLVNSNNLFEEKHKEMVQKLCTLVAMNMPITPRWCRKDKEYVPEPWGCILVPDSQMEYCDDCPVQKECPNRYKHWSK